MKVLIALGAACFIGIGFVAQQHAAYREPLSEMLHLRLLLRLLRNRLWRAGIGSMIFGQVLGAVALDETDVVRVEPVLATSLIFALVAANFIYRERPSWREWFGAILTTAGVAVFLVAGDPHGGWPPPQTSPRWVAVGVVLGVAAALVVTAMGRSLRVRAIALSLAAGALYGLQDTLTRAVLLLIQQHRLAAIASWQPYLLLLVGGLGLLLAQSAFDAAPLRISLPGAIAAEPITGIGLGLFMFGEHLTLALGSLAAEAAGLAALVCGIMTLGRSPFLAKPEEEAPARRRAAQH